jgi:hypothetical protein
MMSRSCLPELCKKDRELCREELRYRVTYIDGDMGEQVLCCKYHLAEVVGARRCLVTPLELEP